LGYWVIGWRHAGCRTDSEAIRQAVVRDQETAQNIDRRSKSMPALDIREDTFFYLYPRPRPVAEVLL